MIEKIKQKLDDFVARRVDLYLWQESENIEREQQRRALAATVDLVERSFGAARAVRSRAALLKFALEKLNNRTGLFLEFGVYQGSTINLIASETNSVVHGFDSFEGLPEFWRSDMDAGAFKVAELPKVRANVSLHKGWFSDTLPLFLERNHGPVSFLHVDCDLYSSTKTIFTELADRLISGSVIVFDEYFNYAGWQEGEYKAFMEFSETGKRFEYLAYNCRGQQAAVRLL